MPPDPPATPSPARLPTLLDRLDHIVAVAEPRIPRSTDAWLIADLAAVLRDYIAQQQAETHATERRLAALDTNEIPGRAVGPDAP